VPEKSGIVNGHVPANTQRGLLFITKILQNLVNNTSFKEKEMLYFNSTIEKNKSRLTQFLTETSKPMDIPVNLKPKIMSDESYAQLKQEVIDIIDKIEPVLYTV